MNERVKDVSPEFQGICETAMQREREERYDGAETLLSLVGEANRVFEGRD